MQGSLGFWARFYTSVSLLLYTCTCKCQTLMEWLVGWSAEHKSNKKGSDCAPCLAGLCVVCWCGYGAVGRCGSDSDGVDRQVENARCKHLCKKMRAALLVLRPKRTMGGGGGGMCILSWYSECNGSHFAWPSNHRMTGWVRISWERWCMRTGPIIGWGQ